MKRKILLFLLGFCAVFSLASCGSKKTELKIGGSTLQGDFKSFEELECGNYEVIITDKYGYISPGILHVYEHVVDETHYKNYILFGMDHVNNDVYHEDITDIVEIYNKSHK